MNSIKIIGADSDCKRLRSESLGFCRNRSMRNFYGSQRRCMQKKKKHSRAMFGSTPENRPQLWSPSIRDWGETAAMLICVCRSHGQLSRGSLDENKQCKLHVLCLRAYLSIIGQRHWAWRERWGRWSGGYHNALVSVNEPFPAKWIIDWLWPALWSL